MDPPNAVPGLTFGLNNPNSVILSGIPTQAGDYNFSISAQDNSVPLPQIVTATFALTISPLPTPISLTCNPNTGPTTVAVAYKTTCTVSGGRPPYSFQLNPPNQIVAGLTMTQSGESTANISGTPVEAGNYNFGIRVQDSGNPTQNLTVTFTGTLTSGAPPPFSLTCNPSTGPETMGVPYATSCIASGGTPPYSFGLSPPNPIPAGLAIGQSGPNTGSISGIPTGSGEYSFGVFAQDSSSPPKIATLTFTGIIAGFQTENAASFQPGTIAADSIASLLGSVLAPQTERSTGTAPLTLGGASVQVTDSSGTTRSAAMLFASDTQINFVVPEGTSLGKGTVTVKRPAGTVSGPVTVAGVAPGIFTLGGTVAAAFYLRVDAGGHRDQEVVFDPATGAAVDIPRLPGDSLYLILFGTGFRHYGASVTATIAGQGIPILGAVAQPTDAGLDQVDIGPLPPSLPSGNQTLSITVDGLSTNSVLVRLQ